jgi:hypothetical protein
LNLKAADPRRSEKVFNAKAENAGRERAGERSDRVPSIETMYKIAIGRLN